MWLSSSRSYVHCSVCVTLQVYRGLLCNFRNCNVRALSRNSYETFLFHPISIIPLYNRVGRFSLFFEIYERLVIKSGTCVKNSCAQNISCLGVHLLPPQGGQSCNFSKKAWNLTFRFDITVFISVFTASYNLVVGCT